MIGRIKANVFPDAVDVVNRTFFCFLPVHKLDIDEDKAY